MRRSALVLVALAAAACGPIDQSGGSGSGNSPDGGVAPDGGAGGGGTDGGVASGGGAPLDCTNVLPSTLGSAATITTPHGRGDVCWNATSDLAGNVATESHPGSMGASFVATWYIWNGSGAQRGTVSGAGPYFLGQQDGFEGPQQDELVLWSSTGAAVHRSSLENKCAHDTFYAATGGSLVLERCGSKLKARRFDAQGNQVADANIGDATAAGGVVDSQDRALIAVAQGGGYAARWYDRDLKPASDPFTLPGHGNSQPMVRALIGGGAAIQIDGSWVATARSGSGPEGVPDWLSSHANYDLQTIRQGRAYALIPRAGASPHDTLDLVSGSGERCGSLKFPSEGLSIGPDGTVIGAGGEAGCTNQIWTGLLR